MAAYASPWAGVVPASPGSATHEPGSGSVHRACPAAWQSLVSHGRAADAGPGATARPRRIAAKQPRRSHVSEAGRTPVPPIQGTVKVF